MKMRERVTFALVILAIIAGAVVITALTPSKTAPQPSALPSYCANGAVPSACIFGLQHSPYVIQSAYSYEANLLDGDIPVGDYDYMLPYGSERVRLPGGSWNRYSYEGALYIPGSGWVARFIAPNGGHFALLHLQYVNGSGIRAGPLPNLPPPVFPEGHSGDDNTAQAAARLIAGSAVSVSLSSTYQGGDAVGLSGWPTWPIYSNGGPGGPADSHLCVLLSARSLAWFWKVATGKDHKPRIFPAKKWGTTRYRDKRGHLVWSAAWTYHNYQTSIYPHLKGDRWYGHTATRRYGFSLYRFHGSKQGRVLRCWPHYGRCKLSRT